MRGLGALLSHASVSVCGGRLSHWHRYLCRLSGAGFDQPDDASRLSATDGRAQPAPHCQAAPRCSANPASQRTAQTLSAEGRTATWGEVRLDDIAADGNAASHATVDLDEDEYSREYSDQWVCQCIFVVIDSRMWHAHRVDSHPKRNPYREESRILPDFQLASHLNQKAVTESGLIGKESGLRTTFY